MLVTAIGSWGEIAPLLEIALRFKEEGKEVEFATTPDWADKVESYGIKCHRYQKTEKHTHTLDGFTNAHLTGRMDAMLKTIEKAKPNEIISGLYVFHAQVYGVQNDIPVTVTTTSPYYLMKTEESKSFRNYQKDILSRVKALPINPVGIYPWYLHSDVGIPCVGFPVLRQTEKLSDELAKFIEEPYVVITRGTLVDGELDRAVNAIHAYGLKCLYLGPRKCKADLSAYFTNHAAAVSKAAVCITHAGVGTTVDCMGIPMVVDPCGYDQRYNADRLIELKVAVGVQSSYIRAIARAMEPRSYLPNSFSFDAFKRLHDPQGDTFRFAADVGERAALH